MTEPNKSKSPNWFANITPDVLSRASSSVTNSGADYAQTGSICTERREALPETLPPRTNNGRTSYHPDPQTLRNAGFSEEEIKQRCGGKC
jgi:hypothetical protein